MAKKQRFVIVNDPNYDKGVRVDTYNLDGTLAVRQSANVFMAWATKEVCCITKAFVKAATKAEKLALKNGKSSR